MEASAREWLRANRHRIKVGQTEAGQPLFRLRRLERVRRHGRLSRRGARRIHPSVATNNGGRSITPLVACTNTLGSSSCAGCPAGYTGDGRTCADVDECALGTAGCSTNASCSNVPGSFTCSCEPGFTGDGITCESEPEATGCGCRTSDPKQSAAWILPLGVLLGRRRRRRRSSSDQPAASVRDHRFDRQRPPASSIGHRRRRRSARNGDYSTTIATVTKMEPIDSLGERCASKLMRYRVLCSMGVECRAVQASQSICLVASPSGSARSP